MIKRYFLTGLAFLLPIVLTIWIIIFVINLLTRPFQQLTEGILSRCDLLEKPFLFLSAEQFFEVVSKGLIIVILISITFFLGFLAKIFVVSTFIRFSNAIMLKIPIVNKIYKAVQDVVHTLLQEKRQSFSQVVFVPFPDKDSYSIGMVTRECLDKNSEEVHAGLISVFVPAAPNPTMGFMLFLRREDLIFVDMKVDDALCSIISCGVIFNQPKIKHENTIFKNN